MADKIKDRKEKLKKEQNSMRKANFYANADKGYRKADSDYKKVDPGFKKRKSDDNKIKDSIFDSSMGKSQEVFDEIKASRREAGRTTKAKGGRAGYSVGGKAIRGVSKILLKK